ncbi:hypothetical protein CRUP_014012 [Coryphaenoides rupestris]|nr:hypothetical protein CRUP_014012 [Coryphaenoides rupestris]
MCTGPRDTAASGRVKADWWVKEHLLMSSALWVHLQSPGYRRVPGSQFNQPWTTQGFWKLQ